MPHDKRDVGGAPSIARQQVFPNLWVGLLFVAESRLLRKHGPEAACKLPQQKVCWLSRFEASARWVESTGRTRPKATSGCKFAMRNDFQGATLRE